MRRLTIHAIEEIVTGSDDVLAQTLRQARVAARLTRRGLALAAGVTLGEIDYLEAGRIGAFASPERARMVVLAYCDAARLDPAAALGRLEPYARRQLLIPPLPAAADVAGALRALSVVIVAGLIAWQAATLFAEAGAQRGTPMAAGPVAMQ